MKKIISIIPLLFLIHLVQGQDVRATRVKSDSALTGPVDTLKSARNGSIASKNGINYFKDGDPALSNGHWIRQISSKDTTSILATKTDIAGLSGGGGISDGDKGDVTVSAAGSSWLINNNAISNAKLRQSAALSIMGRSANSTGNIADISASSDGQLLRRSGTTLGFGSLDMANTSAVTGLLPDGNISSASAWNAKISNITGLVSQGTNVTISGLGTSVSPFVINATGGAGGGLSGGNAGSKFRLYLPASSAVRSLGFSNQFLADTSTTGELNQKLDTSIIRTVLNSYDKSQINTIANSKTNLSDTANMLANYTRRAELLDTANALRITIGNGGGSGPSFVKSLINSAGTVALINDVTTPKKGYYYGASQRKDSARGYHELEETFLGTLYNANTWSTTGDFIQTGVTASVVSNKIQVTPIANNTFTATLDIDNILGNVPFQNLQRWKFTAKVKIDAVSSTSFGWGIGTHSYNDFGMNNGMGRFGGQTGNGSIIQNGGGLTEQLDSTIRKLSWSSGDYLIMTVERNGHHISTKIYNSTTNTVGIDTSYDYSWSIAPSTPNTGKFAFFLRGGQITIDSISITSTEPKNAMVMFGGDSRTDGYSSTSEQASWTFILNKYYTSAIKMAGGFDRTKELAKTVALAIAMRPKQYVICGIGINDLAQGAEILSVITNRYDSIATALEAAGIEVFHAPMYASTVNYKPIYDHIVATYSADRILPTYPTFIKAGNLTSGGLHQNDSGSVDYADAILNSFKLYPGSNRYNNIPAAADLDIPPYLAIGNVIKNSLTTAVPGNVLFAGLGGKLSQHTNNFIYDSTNNRLGVGVAPLYKIHAFAASGAVDITAQSTSASNVNIHTQNSLENWIFGVKASGVWALTDIGGAERVTVDGSTGSFGIGNTAPVARLSVGTAASILGTISVAGNSSGTITMTPQAAAGTYNWNWPITAGGIGQRLTSQGGGSTAMTWTSAVDSIYKNAGGDSTVFTIDGRRHAVIDVAGSGTGTSNTNAGTGNDLVIENTQEVKRLAVAYGISKDSATTKTNTLRLDSATVYSAVRAFITAMAGGGGGSGTMTNLATGYGMTGGPITTTGTVAFDSATAFPHLRSTLYSGAIPHSGLLGLTTGDDHTQYALLAGRSAGQTYIGSTGTTTGLNIRATSGVGTTGSNILFQVGNNGATEAMRIDNAGKVAIGQNVTSKMLTVKAASAASAVAVSASAAATSASMDYTVPTVGTMSTGLRPALTWVINSAADLGGTDRVTVTQGGLVGVATTAPEQALDVNGQVKIRGIAGAAVGSIDSVVVMEDGKLKAAPFFGESDYTPTATNIANTSAITPTVASWFRIGNKVHVDGKIDITPTTAATLTQLRITLPIPSNFSAVTDCSGGFSSQNEGGGISADGTNDQAVLFIIPIGNAITTYTYWFTYKII